MHYFVRVNVRHGPTESVWGCREGCTYISMGQSEDPYLCPNCGICTYRKEIDHLKTTIDALTNELTSVNCNLPIYQTKPVQLSYSVTSQPRILPNEHKFNVVIRGIKECPQDTPRYQCHKSDLDQCFSILTTVNNDINPHSIRDCFRWENTISS